MKIEQIYTGCLAQGAYYVQSGGEAVIIDPLREIKPYIARAKKDKAIIKYIFETHFHADFVSGHVDLARETGATIVFGPTANPAFDAHIAAEGEVLKIGNVSFKILHTPGHTLESSCYLLRDENGKEVAIFTGDTLFIDDVGRPDLAQKATHLTSETLAGILYDSLQNKIMPLPDNIIVYPAHGAGSACGKHMSKETSDTLGHQKLTNYALKSNNRETFIKELIADQPPVPAYFPANVALNKQGYEQLDNVLKRATKAYSAREFEQMANQTGAVIIDTRDADFFAKSFIPNAINIGIDGNFAPWVGALITDIKQPILIIADPGREEEVATRLARVGYDNNLGYLEGGFKTWLDAGREADSIASASINELGAKLTDVALNPLIIDVRKEDEYETAHIRNAVNVPLDNINDTMRVLPKSETGYVNCASGYRSMIFLSVLRARGYNNLINVAGGFNAVKADNRFNKEIVTGKE